MSGRRGFTLLEMLVATTIMGIAMAGLHERTSPALRATRRDCAITIAWCNWRVCA